MVNNLGLQEPLQGKKIILLFVFAIIFGVGIVSALADVKVDWNADAYDWSSSGAYTYDDNPEKGLDNFKDYIICDEDNDNVGLWANYVDLSNSIYKGYWVSAVCEKKSHDVGRHFEHISHKDKFGYTTVFIDSFATVSCTDNDGDGQVSNSSPSVCRAVYLLDCNDNDAEIKVGGVGSCDCTATGKKNSYYLDADADGWGLNTGGKGGIEACSAPNGYVSNSEDCDDADNKNFPGNTEIFDGKDNNCNNLIDEGFSCSPGNTRPCGTNVGECNKGTQTCVQDRGGGWIWGSCTGAYVGSTSEICTDNKDNDCDSLKDCADSNCVGAQGNSGQICQPSGETLCSDGKDNDDDGLKDYAEDKSFCVGTYWASDSLGKNLITTMSAQSGDTVYLVLAEPGLTGTEVFEIYEQDASGGDDLILTSTTSLNPPPTNPPQQRTTILAWTITQADIDEAVDSGESYPLKFYFKTQNKVSVCREGYGISPGGLDILAFQGESSGFKGLIESQDREFQNLRNLITSCDQATTKNSCNSVFPACHWMDYQSPILQLDWISQPAGGVCGDGFIDLGEECDDKNTKSGDGCSSTCKIEKPIGCSKYVLCSDAKTKVECEEADSCGLGPPNIDCADPDIECGCSWDATKNLCNSYFNKLTVNPIGTCAFQENEITNCESSDYYEYSTIATWSPSGTTPSPDCVGGTFGPIMCSAKTKLPLESKFGILLTILAIIGIYFLFFRKIKLK